jgi:lantibiotic biosynthesis protein
MKPKLPLLHHGAARREALSVLGELARAFVTLRPSAVQEPSLAGGTAGIAVAHSMLARVFPRNRHHEHVSILLDHGIEQLGQQTLGPSLHEGFTGLAWAVGQLRPKDAGEMNAEIDDALSTYLDHAPRAAPFDVIAGLAGLAVYARERLEYPSGRRLSKAIVKRLADVAERRPGGVAWRSPKLGRHRTRTWDLGVAHGTPGALVVLAAACADGVASARVKARLSSAVEWMLSQELPSSSPSCFSAEAATREPARAAWCYGDPGVAGALLATARAVRNRAWEKEAVRIALRAAARPLADTGVVDAGLCHGAAGLAHVFHRLYRATGDERFADAARVWIRRTLAMRRARGGFAGFVALSPGPRGKVVAKADPGFLTGAAGIALMLAAAVDEAEPTWDRVLALSS